MRDRYVIIAVLVLALVALTSPVWYARVEGESARGPDLKRPLRETACVMPVAYMRTSHMDLLMTWRDGVVRRHERTWTAPDGKHYAASLSGTCLKCHSNKAEFCDRCHAYANVAPYCWDCHVDPAAINRSGQ